MIYLFLQSLGMEEAGERAMNGDWEFFLPFFLKLGQSVLIVLAFWLAFRIIDSVLRRTFGRLKKVEVGVQQLLLKSLKLTMITLGLVTALSTFINITPLLAGLGVVGLAVGFAAQDTIQNFFSGITILLDQPFKVNDNIVVDGTFGTIMEITLRSTRLRTPNNEVVVLPNSTLINQRVTNHTMLDMLRIEVPFGIAYKEFPQEAREVVLALTQGDDRISTERPPTIVVTGMNDSSVDMNLRLWLHDPKQELDVRATYNERIREALRKADIEIPFPHIQLAIDEAKAFEGAAFMQQNFPKA